MNIKKLLVICFSLFFLYEKAFSSSEIKNKSIDIETQAGTLYIDSSDSSYSYCGNIAAEIDTEKLQFFVNAQYTGASSNLKLLNGKLNNNVFSTGLGFNNSKADIGFFFGGLSEIFKIKINAKDFCLKDVSYGGGFADFSIKLPQDFSVQVKLLAGTQKSNTDDLYVFYGNINTPFFWNGELNISLPLSFGINIFYSNASLYVFNDIDEQSGKGLLDFWWSKAEKSFSLERKAAHNIKIDLGFLYTAGEAAFTESTGLPKTIFYPYSYIHADGNAALYFLTFGTDYSLQKNNFQFLLETAMLVNVYSQLQYYYKITSKKSIFFDGSIKRGEDTFVFSNGDSLVMMNMQALYNLTSSNNLAAAFSARKDLVIPVITEKTRALFFGDEDKKTESSTDNSQAGEIIKTILLSGLSFGVKLSF